MRPAQLTNRVLSRASRFLESCDRSLAINDRGTGAVVLSRYYLLFRDKTEAGQPSRRRPLNIFLHRFQGTDAEPMHDHPWAFMSIVLAGRYREITPAGVIWRTPWSVAARPASWRHRIEVDPAEPECWTLVVRGPRTREWGYWPQGLRVPWRRHLGLPE